MRDVFDAKLDPKILENFKYADRIALRRQVLDELIARYPREFEPHRQLISSTRWRDPSELGSRSKGRLALEPTGL